MIRMMPKILALVPRRAGPLDRRTFRAALCVLVVWSACLWILSGRAFGCCWAGVVEMAAAELAVAAAALNLPGAVFRSLFALAERVLRGRPAGRDAAISQAGRARLRVRLLRRLMAAACLTCAAGGLATTGLIWAASAAMGRLGGMFLLSGWAWAVVRLVVAAVVMAPLAVAAAGLVVTGSLLRRCGPSDPYRYVHRDLIWAASAGLAVAAALWWAGLNLLGAAMVCPVLLVGVGGAGLALGGAGAPKPGRAPAPPASQPRQLERWWNLGAWALPAWVLVLQCRGLRDAVGADWPGTWMWVAASAAVMSLMTARLDRRVRVGTSAEALGAAVGALVVAAGEAAALLMASAGGPEAWLWLPVAAAGQLLFSALWAVVLARRRRAFAAAGPPGRLWPADGALGAAAGAGAAMALLSSPASAGILAGTFLAALVALVLAGTTAAAFGRPRPARSGSCRGPTRWAGAGLAGIAATVSLFVGLAQAARTPPGTRVAIGGSLTAVQEPGGRVFVLPKGPGPLAGDALGIVAGRLIRRHPGRWWIVMAGSEHSVLSLAGRSGSSRRDRTGRHRPGAPILPQWGFVDTALARLPGLARPPEQADRVSFTLALSLRRRRFDGIYLSGLRADHPEARCLYNREVLTGCLRRLHPGGLLVVRTACAADAQGRALSVAETFRRVADGGAAAIVQAGGGVELLLIAPAGAGAAGAGLGPLQDAAAGIGAEVFDLERLALLPAPPGPISISAPCPGGWGAPGKWSHLFWPQRDTKNLGR